LTASISAWTPQLNGLTQLCGNWQPISKQAIWSAQIERKSLGVPFRPLSWLMEVEINGAPHEVIEECEGPIKAILG
jgi:hypothetical protein